MSTKKEAPDWFGCGKTITQESWDGFLKAKADYHAKQDALAKLGSRVLEIMAEEKDWNAGTLNDIAAVAYDLNLADCEPDGIFRNTTANNQPTQKP